MAGQETKKHKTETQYKLLGRMNYFVFMILKDTLLTNYHIQRLKEKIDAILTIILLDN